MLLCFFSFYTILISLIFVAVEVNVKNEYSLGSFG